MTGPTGFRFTVEGQYVTRSPAGNGKITKQYSIKIVLPSTESALSVIKNKLLLTVLKRNYPDVIRFRTYDIVHVEPLGQATTDDISDTSLMDLGGLTALIRREKLPVDLALYPDILKLRTAIGRATENPEQFVKDQDAQRKELEKDKELAALNPHQLSMDPAIPGGDTTLVNGVTIPEVMREGGLAPNPEANIEDSLG